MNALVGAPMAIGSHAILLIYAGDWVISNPIAFAFASWPIFFYLSVGRIYVFRRVWEKYHIRLEPYEIYKQLKGIVTNGNGNGNGEEKEKEKHH